MTDLKQLLAERVGKAVGDSMGVCTLKAAEAAVDALHLVEARTFIARIAGDTSLPAQVVVAARELLAKMDGV